jgi:ribonuclease G
MPTVDHIGISRRIEKEEERKRLKEIVQSMKPPNGGFIVRTACDGSSQKNMKNDMDFLVKLWKEIQRNYDKKSGAGLIHADLDVELRAVRDLFSEDVKRLVVDDAKTHKKIVKFVQQFMPKLKTGAEHYTGEAPIFDHFGIELEVSRALGRKVWLKSGGYIIIDEAEALVAIDVNTGRYVGKRNLEDTIVKTNLEAVKEIAYQLRLRNCGGIIILDFIDMERETNREKVLSALKEELIKDRAKTNVLNMSSLGLVEMTRKRTRESLVKALCEPCSYCDGKGFIKSKTTICYEIFRELQREGKDKDSKVTHLHVHPDLADWLYDEEREMLEKTEELMGRRIILKTEDAFHIEQFEIFSKH